MLILLLACGSEPREGVSAEDSPPIETTPPEPDADGDGFDADDCDDADASVFPGALELLGDDLDSDCDGGADTTPVERLDDLVAIGLRGLDLARNSTDVFIAVTEELRETASPTANWIGRLEETGFHEYYATYLTSSDEWTSGVDLAATDEFLVWSTAYLNAEERSLLTGVLRLGSNRHGGERIVTEDPSEFADVDLFALEDGTFVASGCDPTYGEIVLMHGTAEEIRDARAGYDFADTYIVEDCSVAGLVGAMIVADPPEVAFDLYSYNAENGLSYQFSYDGYSGFDLETIVRDGQMYTADAEGAAGLRVVTPVAEEWHAVADVQEVDFDISPAGTLAVGFVDAFDEPWVAVGAAGALRPVSLAAWAPGAKDIAVVFTPDEVLIVAIRYQDEVYWSRWGVAP